jgi:hypothetical protein
MKVVRARESILRFGEPRTITSTDAPNLAEELFNRYVRMELPVPQATGKRA